MTAFRLWRPGSVVLFLVAFASPLQAALPPEVNQRIDALVQQAMTKQHIPGLSIAVATGNELQLERGYGLADVENNVAVSPETKFRTASIAKSLTAVAAMKLVEEGKLDLDAEIQTYLPGFPKKQWPITSRQLLGHLAGVRHYKSADESSMTIHFPTVQAGLAVFADDPLLHEPGTAYLYSSFGFNLLGAVMEKASGEKFDALLMRTVCKPAGMAETCIDSVFEIIPHRTNGYMWIGTSDKDEAERKLFHANALYNARLHDTSSKIPGGGLLSTSGDLVRLGLALNRTDLLKRESVEALWTEGRTKSGKPTQYGLGWRIEELGGEKLVGHSGGQSGTSTYLLATPSRKSAVAVMCNLQGASLKSLATSILTAVNTADAPAVKKAPAQLTGNIPAAAGYEEIASKLSSFITEEIAAKNIPAFFHRARRRRSRGMVAGVRQGERSQEHPGHGRFTLPRRFRLKTLHRHGRRPACRGREGRPRCRCEIGPADVRREEPV